MNGKEKRVAASTIGGAVGGFIGAVGGPIGAVIGVARISPELKPFRIVNTLGRVYPCWHSWIESAKSWC